MDENANSGNANRRKFLKKGLLTCAGTIMGTGLMSSCSPERSGKSSEKVKLLSTDGKLVEVDKDQLHHLSGDPASRREARQGIPGKMFVLVVDLSRCKNAGQCKAACDKHHNLTPDRPFIKILKMQDNPKSSPYWMPKKCFQCDNPPCVKVCPVGATYKRTDGIVLVDNKRCIGCRFCMAACPYSARVFNWGKPKPPEERHGEVYSPETSSPSLVGTVEKCDFCPDTIRKGELPPCIPACPNGALYFGDEIDDAVTNGFETVRLTALLREKAGYRYLEELGTEPRVYYLPPANRMFPFEDDPSIESG
jgi:molybdopterin-containing oxidoreductase family iron-sulfur binding subunit